MKRGESPGAQRLWAVYLGGVLGPFGALVILPMLPEIAQGLHTTVAVAGTGTTAYLVPFSLSLFLFSTVRLPWSPGVVLHWAYWGFFVGSLVTALAPTIEVFLVGRVMQGLANALISPSALAILLSSRGSSGSGTGRRIGTYGTMQALGQMFAPLVAGLCVTVANWRLAMAVAALIGLVLAMNSKPPAVIVTAEPEVRPRDPLATMKGVLLWSMLGAFAYASSTAMTLLIPIWINDNFGSGSVTRGFTVAAFGAAGVVLSRPLGRLADALDLRTFGAVCCGFLALACGASYAMPHVGFVIVLMAVAGAAAAGIRVGITSLALARVREVNRASSLQMGLQFLAGGLVPLPLLPLYSGQPAIALEVMGAGALIACVGLAFSRLKPR